MKHPWMRSLLACAIGTTITALAACSDDDASRSRIASEDASGPEASLPSNGDDAGVDVATSKPPFDPADVAVTCAQTPCAVELVAGSAHFCARMQDGSVWCWGDNTFGALGGGDEAPNEVGLAPVAAVGVSGATQISAAAGTTCARITDGTVRCWGANTDGQLGLQQTPALADYDVHSTPSVVALGVSASRVDVGQRVACALGPANALHCWGANDKKQLARRGEDGDPVLGPAAADLDGQSVVRTGEANDASFGVTRDGALLGWGVVWGREASVSPDAVPFALPSLTSVTRFAIGSMHACAIADGILHCWGRGDQGALGTGTPDLERFPVAVGIGGDRTSAYPQQLSVADRNTCVRTTDGTVACCGDDAKGQLGRGPGGAPSALFAKATVFTGEAVAVASSNATTCVLVQGGTVQCWGGNGAGELGQGSHDDEPHPSPITVAFP